MIIVFINTREWHPAPHIVPLYGLDLRPCVSGEESEVPINAWASDASFGQAPFSIQVEPAAEYKVAINKLAAVNVAIWCA